MSDPTEIAKGLTWEEVQELRAHFYSTSTTRKMEAMGLLKSRPSSWHRGPVYVDLTPLGRAVRRVLEGG